MKTQMFKCNVTKKYCYTSEAKALRNINKFDNLRRTYFCEYCDSWHNTKIGKGLAIKLDLIEPTKQKEYITKTKIQKRLDFLLNIKK